MPFKPQNNLSVQQTALLEDIRTSQNALIQQVNALSERISSLEQCQKNFSPNPPCSAKNLAEVIDEKFSDILSKISEHSKENFTSDSKALTEKIDFNSTVVVGASLIICVMIILKGVIFSWHFWSVPAQTKAVNQYIYEQTLKEKAAQPPQ